MWTTQLLALAAVAGPVQTPEPAAEPLPLFLYWRQSYDPDRTGETWGLMRRMRDHLQANYPQRRRPRVYLEAFGGGGNAHWFNPYADLADRLRFEVGQSRDAGWRELVAESDALYEEWEGADMYLLPLGGVPLEGGLRPFRELRVVDAVPSRIDAARRHARDVVEYLERHYPEVDAAAYSADLNDPGAIYYMIDHYDLSSWEAVRARLLDDDAYLELRRQGEELFLAQPAREAFLVDFEYDWSSSLVHYNQAKALEGAGDLIGAAACYRRALEIDPKLADAAHFLGHTLEELGDPVGAIASYRYWKELVPDFPMAHRDLAWVLATCPLEELRDPEEALLLAERAVELDGQVSLFWLALGVCRYRANDLEGCVAALDRAIELDGSGDPYDWLFLAMAHHRLGHGDDALAWFARSIDWVAENGPDPEYTRYSLRRKGELEEFLAEARGVLGIEGESGR